MVTYGRLTEYPEIYNKVYWGQFRTGEGNKGPDRRIIDNRNNLAVRRGIIKTVSKIPKCISENFPKGRDHTELYELSTGKRLLISSPYDRSEKNHREHIANGFTEIEKIYSYNANTYAAILKKRNDRWVIEVQEKEKEEKKEEDECVICMEKIENINNCVLACGHKYHMRCMVTALVRKNECPLCRRKVR